MSDTAIQRFERFRVELSASDCWTWTGATYRNGYGAFGVSPGRVQRAHRVAFSLFRGEIPDGLHIDHTCHRPAECAGGVQCPHRRCVNPAHLEAVTKKVNTLRGNGMPAIHARKTHCKHGHPFDASNTYYCPPGSSQRRRCRQCDRDRRLRYRAAKSKESKE